MAPTKRQKAVPVEEEKAPLLDGYALDVVAIVLIALGVVGGLGVYADSAGPVGRGLSTIFGVLVGLFRYLAPVALVAGAVLMLVARHTDRADGTEDDDGSRPAVRRIAGGVLLGVVVVGLLHLALVDRSVDGLDQVRDAGGVLGALIGSPLGALLSPWGAAPVLVLAGILGISLVSGMSLAQMGSAVVRGLRPAAKALGAWLGDLFRVGDGASPEDEPTQPSGTELFDQDAPGQGLPPKRARAAKPKDAAPAEATADKPAKPVEPTVFLPANVEPTQLEMDLGPGFEGSDWKLPPMDLLSRSGAQEIDTDAVAARGRQLEATLAEHGVQTRLSGMVVGPTVTRYELELGIGVKVNSVVNLQKDIAYSMASPDVRIMAPIPGKQAIGVEVPNAKRQIVAVADILTSPEAQRSKHPLEVAVGRDIEGRNVMVNLATMPHVLIAGQTGAGKSSCINSIMTSILMRATPDQVRLILIDPKRVELTQYNRVPHLLTQVVTNPKKAANALSWAVKEMERRYELLEKVGFRDIGGYNAAFDRGELVPEPGEDVQYPRLPYILVVVDELADLMMVAARDVEESINRIAAKARAVGVHLVIATQRPSVDVITGVIKANIPARFAFAVATTTDSKVILGYGGAEKLVGKGDMLMLGPSSGVGDRIQGCWVEEAEAAKVVSHWRRQVKELDFVDDVQGEEAPALPAGMAGSGDPEDDDLLLQAMELVVRSNFGSTSMLQRKLKVGFARAGRLMDLLEQRGVVGPSTGSKAREVLMTVPELDVLMGRAPAADDDDADLSDDGFDAEADGGGPGAVDLVERDDVDLDAADDEPPRRPSRAVPVPDNGGDLPAVGGFGIPLDD